MKKFSCPLVALLQFPAILSAEPGTGPLLKLSRITAQYGNSIEYRARSSFESTLIFPDYADGEGWSVQLVLSNLSASPSAALEVEVFDPQGEPVSGFFDSETAVEIPAYGSRVLRSAGAGPLRRGWIQVRVQTDSVRGFLTYRHALTGREVGVQPVPLGDHFALFVEETSETGTGLALFKPESSSKIELQLRDETGSDPLDGEVIQWWDFRQSAGTMPEWLDVDGVGTEFLGDFRGLLFLRTEGESLFAPQGLRFGKGTGLLPAVPAVPIVDAVVGAGNENVGKMYWTDVDTNKIQRANLDGSGVEDLGTSGLRAPSAIALDLAGGKMYWTDWGTEKIQRANLDGSGVEDLVTSGLSIPQHGIALDPDAGKMYWTDWGTEKIQRANLDGSRVEDLVTSGLSTPKGIALDPDARKMYWGDSGTYKIQRANLDGSRVEDLVTTSVSIPAGGIALDPDAGKMYWTNVSSIRRANLDGSGVEGLVRGLNFAFGIALDLDAGKMYWADGWKGKIQRANLDGSGVEDLVTSGLEEPTGIALALGPSGSTTNRTKLYFPDYVNGGGWSVQLVLSNLSASRSATVEVKVYNPQGSSVARFFGSGRTFDIPSLGSRVLRSSGTGGIRRGWIEVETESPAVSGLLTYSNAQSGVEVGVEPVELGNQFALFIEESSEIGTGLAIFKPDSSSEIELRIRDEDGDDPLNGVFVPHGNFHQRARTIPEWLDVAGVDTGFLRNFRGLLFLRTADGSTFAPLGLRFGKRTGSLSSVPIIRMSDSIADDDDCASPNPFGGCDDPGPGTGDPETPPAPAVKPVSGETTELEIIFEDSFKAGETKAYDAQVRTKSPRGSWKTGCTTVTNTAAQAGTGDVTITATGLDPGTTYEVRYRQRNASRCGSGTPGPWSAIGEGRTNGGDTSAPTVSLSASPTSIERGKSTTLRWSSTNAASATIAPGVGSVPTSGSRRLSPTQTTTYRITVRSSDGQTASDTVRVTVTEPPTDPPDDDFKAFKGLRIGNDGSVRLQVGGVTLGTGPSGCLSGGGSVGGQVHDYHWSAWQRNTGSGWKEVSGSRKTGGLCGYDLSSAGSGKYRLVVDMTLDDVRGKYKSENEVTK